MVLQGKTINHARCRNLHYASFFLRKKSAHFGAPPPRKNQSIFPVIYFVGFAEQNHPACTPRRAIHDPKGQFMRQRRNSWSSFAARIHARSANMQFMEQLCCENSCA